MPSARNAVLCYNLLVLVSIAASGLAMHALVRAVTGSTPAAFIAGLAWACWPYRTAHLLHIQLQALYFMPLALLFLHRVVARRRWRDAMALAVTVSLQAISSIHYGVMTAVMLAVASIVLAVATGQWRARHLWVRLAGSAAIGIVLTGPSLLPYVRVQQSEGFGRTLFEVANHSASWQSYTQVPPDNLLYGRSGLLAPRVPGAGQRDRRNVEHQMFPGFLLLGLATAGALLNYRRDARPVVLSSLALVVTGGVLSFGPEGLPRALRRAPRQPIRLSGRSRAGQIRRGWIPGTRAAGCTRDEVPGRSRFRPPRRIPRGARVSCAPR